MHSLTGKILRILVTTFRSLSFPFRSAKSKTLILISAGVALIVIGGLVIYFLPRSQDAVGSDPSYAPARSASAGDTPSSGTPVCRQPILDSTFSYDGAAGSYTSGTAGLPTYGAPGTDFPDATSGIVIAPGDHSQNAAKGFFSTDRRVYYFEPGEHVFKNGMWTADNAAYIGGYTSAAGKAVLDGVNGSSEKGDGGSSLSSSNSGVVNASQTWEYLTIQNFSANRNDAVMGDVNGPEWDNGDIYKYDTIGPNEYGYTGAPQPVLNTTSDPGQGGGYAIDMGSNTTVEYNCLYRNAQGAFNGSGYNININHNEISWNGLGEYPDTGGPGASPMACGCSGGGKLGFSLNATLDDNYVHDNYNSGIWLDFDNSGADISGNYIASNWGAGISYEASYNANISDNTLVGNEWASDGPFPRGYHGLPCGQYSCSFGGGIEGGNWGFPSSAIEVFNSGGNANLSSVSLPASLGGGRVTSRYRGQLLIQDNHLYNNFGGVGIYTDTDRYPDNLDRDSACGAPLGPLAQRDSTTYYQQNEVLQTASSDATISGTRVTSAAGTTELCDDFGSTSAADANDTNASHAPVTGMAVYDMNSGAFLGTVASVANARSFTLDRSPGNETRARLLLSAYGGCGPADYYRGGPGVKTGNPPAYYWDNCVWGSRNVTVSGNIFSINATTVANCTAVNDCAFQQAIAFNAGVPKLMQFFDDFTNVIAKAVNGLGNVWSDNTYYWSGGGPGQWQFEAGSQGNQVSLSDWRSIYGQDAGSTFNHGSDATGARTKSTPDG
jgi:parallel beta-helix repeat protein